MRHEAVDPCATPGIHTYEPHISQRLQMPPDRRGRHVQLPGDRRRLILPHSQAAKDCQTPIAGQRAQNARQIKLSCRGVATIQPVDRAARDVCRS